MAFKKKLVYDKEENVTVNEDVEVFGCSWSIVKSRKLRVKLKNLGKEKLFR